MERRKNATHVGYGNVKNALGVEFLIGRQFGDRMTGNTANNHFDGNFGNDTLTGGCGDWGGGFVAHDLIASLNNHAALTFADIAITR